VDVPTQILECEARLVAVGDQFGDEYEPEVAGDANTEVACGAMSWLADGVQVGGDFAPYSRTEGGAQVPEKMPCSKLKKKSKVPRELKAAVNEWKEYYEIDDAVFVTEGAPYVEEKEDDLRLHRYQVLVAYSKKFTFAGNPCGGRDEKLFCEAGGSKSARAYNEMEHHLDRARFHAGRAPDRCKQHLKAAVKGWEWFQSMMEEMKQNKKWVSGATYRSKKGELLKEKDFVASFEEKASSADEKLTAKYCSRPQSGAEKTARAGKGKGKAKAKPRRSDDEEEDEGDGED
jgi:hypothetical protein